MICKGCKARFETRDANPDEFNTGYCFKCLHKMGYYDNRNKHLTLYEILEKIIEKRNEGDFE